MPIKNKTLELNLRVFFYGKYLLEAITKQCASSRTKRSEVAGPFPT
jgi:hypothetical protein